MGYGEMYIKSIDEKYKTPVKTEDEFEHLSDGEEETLEKHDELLDV